MLSLIPHLPHKSSHSFQLVADAFLAGEGLPFSKVLSAERIHRVFAKYGALFGLRGIYSTGVVVWAFLSQVLRDGKEASCQAAVARVASYCQFENLEPPSADTGNYCRARAKLPEGALHELFVEVAEETEQQADGRWLWKDRHAKLVDGFTMTMPDTPENQAKYPQLGSQKPGVGFPIARAVAILSLATACVMDATLGPSAGKETGESALLRDILQRLKPRDVAVMDRYFCSYMMIALLQLQGTDFCGRNHHQRYSNFRRGKRLGPYDHLITWKRPQRSTWMSEETYATIPKTLTLREIRYDIVVRGQRTRSFIIITTLTDAKQYTKDDIAQLYGFRWNAELDIRSIKSNLNLDHVRCKSPEMVRCEMWTTLLGYHLIRTTAAGAALLHGVKPREISFVATCQYVLAFSIFMPFGLMASDELQKRIHYLLKLIANCRVGKRPGRIEPRVIKRRRHRYRLMTKSRQELKQELASGKA